MTTNFSGGRNIAVKVPPHQYDETVAFYRDTLGLKPIDKATPCFEFGACQLWIDRVEGVSQAEIWLQIIANDFATAATQLHEADVTRRDEIEPLPDGFPGFWISSPASIIHLVSAPDA